MQTCCAAAGVTRDTLAVDELIVGDHVQTAEALLTGGVAYKRGDLLGVTAGTNVVTHIADATLANAQYIMPFDLTAGEATAHAATGRQLQFYNQGEFAQDRVYLSGVALTAPQVLAAKAALGPRKIELRKVL
ncbi:MAG TPA: hypothetical protein VE934_12040 [Polaromonas sp.]|uniref:hypothetical protein n=1 Tax=Polaromonas sp. TaxID=1869339 RepID=UPI002D5105D5|nr:hypothetical protein [Polaromonas sp.]HYW57686.1 hypothetical protein [Polaromonas sp.]